MRVVCDFTAQPKLHEQGEPFGVPACFLPIMGKSCIQHILEYIERLHLHNLDIYLSQYADELEQFIGDGERWGVTLSYHLVKQHTTVASRIAKSETYGDDELIVVCTSTALPFIEQSHLKTPCIFVDTEEGKDTGWRVCTKHTICSTDLPPVAVDTLRIDSAQGYLHSLQKVLSQKGKGLIVLGREIKEGIWVGPGSKIAETSNLLAPTYIGAHVSIGGQSIVGPYAEIGNGCIIDADSYMCESSLLAGSYVGKNLNVQKCIIHQNRILHIPLSTVYAASDEMLFSAIEEEGEQSLHPRVPVVSRIIALVLGLVTLPILCFLWVYSAYFAKNLPKALLVVDHPQKRNSFRIDSVKTSTLRILKRRVETQGNIRAHILWHLIPGFWLVVQGRSRFFGIPYKSLDDFKKLSKDWQGLYLKSPPGVISEADVLYDSYPGDEMLFASEMYYSVMDSPKYNRKLFLRYLHRVLKG